MNFLESKKDAKAYLEGSALKEASLDGAKNMYEFGDFIKKMKGVSNAILKNKDLEENVFLVKFKEIDKDIMEIFTRISFQDNFKVQIKRNLFLIMRI